MKMKIPGLGLLCLVVLAIPGAVRCKGEGESVVKTRFGTARGVQLK